MKLSIFLAEVKSHNNIRFVGSKIKIAKKKNLGSQSLTYTEILNDLLQDNEELTMIAREYKQAYKQVTISDKEIECLYITLREAIEALNTFFLKKLM